MEIAKRFAESGMLKWPAVTNTLSAACSYAFSIFSVFDQLWTETGIMM